MVERIQRLNALDSGMLAAGQELRIPTERLTLKTSPADSTPAGEPGKTRGGTYAVSAPRGISERTDSVANLRRVSGRQPR